MGKWILHNVWLKIGSIVFAFLLWFHVVSERLVFENVGAPIKFRNLPGELVIVNNVEKEVIFQIKTKVKQLILLNLFGHPYISVDLTNLVPGKNSIKLSKDWISLPSWRPLDITGIVRPKQLAIETEKTDKKQVSVRVVIKGTPQDRTFIKKIMVEPDSIILIGGKRKLEEIKEIEKAHAIAYEMHTTAMRMAKAGIYERDIAGAIEGIALAAGGYVAFPVILSRHGEILHNHHHSNLLRDGDMVINDSGAENFMHYASDITRTFPVSGKFTIQQREIYEIVLKAQKETINSIKPGEKNKDIHLKAATIITDGLKDLGLMRGDTSEAVKKGAHALFFPHGLGHMMGLDVHDMENLGEDLVGYDKEVKRSDQFGLAYLRLGKKLQPGYVLTIEPGIYFIPELIRTWQKEKKFEEYIDYGRLGDYIEFGGIRIEDDIVVTEDGHRIIGKPIPKSIEEVEEICQESV